MTTKSLHLLFFFLLLACAATAQKKKDPYAQKAAEIQKEVWGTTEPGFAATTTPADLSSESAVVFARSYSMRRTLIPTDRFMGFGGPTSMRSIKLTTFHERVKINDKSALEDFSTISYQKRFETVTTGETIVATSKVIHDAYIGVKIIKPGGNEVIVNTNEEVLVKDEKSDRVSKLAIPDLQVGDILDYYVTSVETRQNAVVDRFNDNDKVFVLASEYPVLYSSYDFRFSKRDIVKYICTNGAQQFNISTNADGDQIYTLKLSNQIKYPSDFWISKFRQFPYIEISYSFLLGFAKFNSSGILSHESSDDRLSANKKKFEADFQDYNAYKLDETVDRVKDHFDGKKNMKAAPLDSVLNVLYNIRKEFTLRRYEKKDVSKIDKINYRDIRSKVNVITTCIALNKLKIDCEVLVVCSRNSNTLDNIFNDDDFDACIRVTDGRKQHYMFFDDAVTHFNEIPQRYQGEKVIVLKPKRESSSRYSFTESTDVLPVIPAEMNAAKEELNVALLPANMQKLQIQRLVKQTGALRHNDQLKMLPVLDIDNGLMQLSKAEKLEKRLAENPETKKMIKDFNYAFADDASKSVEKFTAEIKAQFDQEPTQVINCKIINNALDSSNPVFQYSASFVLDNLVKKAGNNFIIDAGKLTGSFYKLKDKERKRDLDVYMPCARSFNYIINLTIPEGYAAKGIEEMAVKKVNKTGSFTSAATVNGSVLTIVVNRVYNNNFEKATDWPLLTEVIDAASNFNTQKILLEKK